MTARINHYPEMKESGVPWLGQVPEHWEVRRLKQICTRSALYGANIPASAYSASGIRFLRTTDIRDDGSLKPNGVYISPEDAPGYILATGDLLISRSGTVGRSFLYDIASHGPCAYAGYLVRFVLGSGVVPKYMSYYTKSPSFAGFLKVVSIQSTIENVNGEKYADSMLPVPPLAEQAAIVRYLDYADRKVRHAIRAQQQLIKLLAEQKQAIIQRAVTRGLDPNVRLKPSGVPWLGDVPEHWEVPRLKQVCTRSALYGANVPASEYSTDGIRFLRTTDIRDDGSLKPGGVHVSPESATGYVLDDGDLLISRSGTIGRSFVYDSARHGPCAYAGYLVRFVLSARVVPTYVMYYTKTPAFADFLKLMSIQSTIENVNAEKYANSVLPLPSLSEQSAIVRYLDNAMVDLDRAIEAAHREIDLLREYRTRLIADVVTGKLDVRDVPVPEDETDIVPEELESIDDVEATDRSDDVAEGDSESSSEESA